MRKWRNWCITLFVIVWSLAFHYESVRYFYLEPLLKRPLPKIKFLFPPAGWIMFYNVGESYGYIRIFGTKNGQAYEIDPHDIFRVRTIGFDNIHRGVIIGAASQRQRRSFCRHLYQNFEQFERFRVVSTYYPNFVSNPYEQHHQVVYECSDRGQ